MFYKVLSHCPGDKNPRIIQLYISFSNFANGSVQLKNFITDGPTSEHIHVSSFYVHLMPFTCDVPIYVHQLPGRPTLQLAYYVTERWYANLAHDNLKATVTYIFSVYSCAPVNS